MDEPATALDISAIVFGLCFYLLWAALGIQMAAYWSPTTWFDEVATNKVNSKAATRAYVLQRVERDATAAQNLRCAG